MHAPAQMRSASAVTRIRAYGSWDSKDCLAQNIGHDEKTAGLRLSLALVRPLEAASVNKEA
eukprot:6196526-Pleurochrysis_carterae.AAC.2